jgi:hypothetical protein
LLKVLKGSWVDENWVRMVVFWVWDGDNLDGFPGCGEISKYQCMVKKFNEMDKSFARDISYRIAEIPSVPGQVWF